MEQFCVYNYDIQWDKISELKIRIYAEFIVLLIVTFLMRSCARWDSEGVWCGECGDIMTLRTLGDSNWPLHSLAEPPQPPNKIQFKLPYTRQTSSQLEVGIKRYWSLFQLFGKIQKNTETRPVLAIWALQPGTLESWRVGEVRGVVGGPGKQ